MEIRITQFEENDYQAGLYDEKDGVYEVSTKKVGIGKSKFEAVGKLVHLYGGLMNISAIKEM